MTGSHGPGNRRRYHRLSSAALILIGSFLNLLGAFAALASLGGLGEWSTLQFVGLFGFLEAGTGIAFIVAPNIWRLPVAEVRTSNSTSVRLTPELLLVPQPAAGAKVVAGLLFMAAAAWEEGVSSGTLGLIPALLLLVGAVLALSLVVARAGVARPDLDVVSLVIRRVRHPDREVGPVSLGGIALQLVMQVGIFPFVKLASPSILFGPALAPSMPLLTALGIATLAISVVAYGLWRGRIELHAPAEQQLEVERDLSS